jgi:hypothetical protein
MGTPYKLMTPEQKSRAHAANKRWGERNKEKRAAYKRKHYMENRDKFLDIERERAYQKLYGIGIDKYDAMLVAQDGKCKICDRARPSKNDRFRFFCVDHGHKTGAVRGLLCHKCNGTLGWYEMHSEAIFSYLSVKQ